MAEKDIAARLPLPDLIALQALSQTPLSLVITDAAQSDNPIVYVNRAFEHVSGYSYAAAVNRNCRFLQGPDTDPEQVQKVRDAVEKGEEITVDLLNYRADGEAFWNRLSIMPLVAEDGPTSFFLGVQMRLDYVPGEDPKDDRSEDIDEALREIQHRVKNHLAMIVGMIRMQSREERVNGFDTLARRVETLQLLYEELNARPSGTARRNDEPIYLGAYLTRVANAIAHLDGRPGVRVNVDSDDLVFPFEAATRIGLIVSEILTNAFQHAFGKRERGLVEVRAKALTGGVVRIQITDDGVGLPKDMKWPNETSLGGRIVKALVRGLDATLVVERETVGTTVLIDIPSQDEEDFEEERG